MWETHGCLVSIKANKYEAVRHFKPQKIQENILENILEAISAAVSARVRSDYFVFNPVKTVRAL